MKMKIKSQTIPNMKYYIHQHIKGIETKIVTNKSRDKEVA